MGNIGCIPLRDPGASQHVLRKTTKEVSVGRNLTYPPRVPGIFRRFPPLDKKEIVTQVDYFPVVLPIVRVRSNTGNKGKQIIITEKVNC